MSTASFEFVRKEQEWSRGQLKDKCDAMAALGYGVRHMDIDKKGSVNAPAHDADGTLLKVSDGSVVLHAWYEAGYPRHIWACPRQLPDGPATLTATGYGLVDWTSWPIATRSPSHASGCRTNDHSTVTTSRGGLPENVPLVTSKGVSAVDTVDGLPSSVTDVYGSS